MIFSNSLPSHCRREAIYPSLNTAKEAFSSKDVPKLIVEQLEPLFFLFKASKAIDKICKTP